MAANFWTSNHQKALLSRDCLRDGHEKDYAAGLTDDQIRNIKNFHVQLISDIARNMKLRQRVIGTAVIYFRRFYIRNCFADHDPRLVAQACLYLAAKAEECTVQLKLLKHFLEKRQQRSGSLWVREFTVKEVLDYELLLLEELDYNLVVFSPYRPLAMLMKDAQLSQEMIDTAWAALNDSYLTDLGLIHPPYMLAIGAICMAAAVRQMDIGKWMAELDVDFSQIYEIVTELLNFYNNFRTVISQDECYRLLGGVVPKALLPCAVSTPPYGTPL